MQDLYNILFLITARGGSKGIPGKNIKPLNGKPLLYYAIDSARALTDDENICLSSDDEQIIECATSYGLSVPFIRPKELATDIAGSYEVLLHAYNFYRQSGKKFDSMVLLQPTSPFRTAKQISEAMQLYSDDIDMVVSVCESEINPYYNLFEENEQGYLKLTKEGNYIRRQDCPKTYIYNGAIYIINIKSLLENPLHKFEKVIKYEMDKTSSTDLDTLLDWQWAEFLIEKNTQNENI